MEKPINGKVDLQSVTQKTAAWVFGISPSTLRRWSAPRNKDGTYNLADLVSWKEGVQDEQRSLGDEKLDAEIDRLDHQLVAAYRTGEVDSGNLRSIHAAQKTLESEANIYRTATETIRRLPEGAKVLAIVKQHMDTAKRSMTGK